MLAGSCISEAAWTVTSRFYSEQYGSGGFDLDLSLHKVIARANLGSHAGFPVGHVPFQSLRRDNRRSIKRNDTYVPGDDALWREVYKSSADSENERYANLGHQDEPDMGVLSLLPPDLMKDAEPLVYTPREAAEDDHGLARRNVA